MRKTRNDTAFYYCLYVDDRIPGDTAVSGVAIAGISVVADSDENTNYIIDEDGNQTGERILHYTAPVKMWANISPASGLAQAYPFGTLNDYDKVIVTSDMSCPIDENTVLFIDKPVEFVDAETHEVIESNTLFGDDEILPVTYKVPAYDYVVRRVEKSLHNIRIAVERVEVS